MFSQTLSSQVNRACPACDAVGHMSQWHWRATPLMIQTDFYKSRPRVSRRPEGWGGTWTWNSALCPSAMAFNRMERVDHTKHRWSYPNSQTPNLVGGIPTPLKNDGVRQLGWWHSQYMESHNPFVFQTTNPLLFWVSHPQDMSYPSLPSTTLPGTQRPAALSRGAGTPSLSWCKGVQSPSPCLKP